MSPDPKLWWYLARSTGIVTWGLASASVIWGLLLSTRPRGGRVRPAWLLDLHRHLGGLTVLFLLGHLGALAADSFVHFGWADVLVPMASSWRPGATALGVVAAYLLLVVEATSLARRRLSQRVWRRIHLTSFATFWLGTAHFLRAGTDRSDLAAQLAIEVVAAAVLFLTLVRILAVRSRPVRARA